MRAALLSVIGVFCWDSAQAQIYRANDTGGSFHGRENEAMAQEIAGAYCARWTSTTASPACTGVWRLHRLHCQWSPHVNPYALPAVATRSTCAYRAWGPGRAQLIWV